MHFFSLMTKSKILSLGVIVVAILMFGLSVRGLYGNPSSVEINSEQWKQSGPFELSPERGRFALLYSLVEDHSLQFSLPLARFTTPDLAITDDGKYVSLFAPTVSFLAVPGYVIGKYFGASQVGAYATISLFALMNICLIRALTMRLGVSSPAGWLAGVTFGFATPAFAYGVNLYQHHVSTFIILASIYALLRFRGWIALLIVWFLCGLSLSVDNPNFFMMFPIGVYALARIVDIRESIDGLKIKIKPLYALTLLAITLPLGAFLWFNKTSHNDPFKLSGSLESVAAINAEGRPTQSDTDKLLGIENHDDSVEKTAVGFFKTRNILNGLYIHIFSPDRGIFMYTPVIVLGVFGLGLLYRKHSGVAALLIAVVLVNLVLYSLWGDPWGGWAFASRYLIPGYALLAIGLGLFLEHWKKNSIVLTFFFLLFSYSLAVNTLGAITSSANPPQVEVLGLEQLSGHEEKYTFMRNWQYLNHAGSKSFIYQIWGKDVMQPAEYYFLVTGVGVVLGSLLMGGLVSHGRRSLKNENSLSV